MSNEVLSIFCASCVEKKPKHKSISEYSRIEVSRTPYGLMIWCTRCEKTVADLPYDWSEIDKQHPGICQCQGCKNKD